ncbi:peroxisomal succinyl-coenzyme A thioesterase-like isoform X1 [Gadus macrocephalus]|uniref:peroxisomal succinyl-coenzyme A thioesterase-like isoform X1 n=1 Tax=Gadus macrocephalus TaxID=80720 RepID=UPI0028CB611D|nr:peroxisomal succinyl-coenzyme A thioesterase-like isoform X1 [Gadus macrocephalus]
MMAGAVHPILSVCPSRALSTEKFRVLVENLPPGLSVTLHSLHCSEMKDYWEAFGHYVADNKGTVDVSQEASLGGTYTGKEPMGLLWSMIPVPGSKEHAILFKLYVETPQEVLISVFQGHLSEGFRQKPPLASVVAERWFMAPGLKTIRVREKEIEGILYIPPGPGPFPGVLDVSGFGGDVTAYRPAMLAAQGFVAFGVNYSLPGRKFTVDYFLRAFEFLQEHPLVISNRVGLIGMSLGAIVVLNMACRTEAISPRCCVSINGSHLLMEESVDKLLNNVFQMKEHTIRRNEQNHVTMRGMQLPIPNEATINMENINCPLLLVVGEDDLNFPSAECAELMAKRMHTAGKEHLLTILSYPGAGHVLHLPNSNLIRISRWRFSFFDQKETILWGGHPKPHAFAEEDSWDKILAFLKQHLYPGPQSVPDAAL